MLVSMNLTSPHPHEWEYGRVMHDFQERIAVVGYICAECFAEIHDPQPMLYPDARAVSASS